MKQRTITFRNTKQRQSPEHADDGDAPRPARRLLSGSAPVLPPMEPRVLTHSFHRLIRGLGLKNLTFHDLRHDAASRLAMSGVPLRTIAEVLGHRDLAQTVRYAHLSPHHPREAMRALDAAPSSTGTISAPAQ